MLYLDSLGSTWYHNSYQMVTVILWLYQVCTHDTYDNLNFAQITVQTHFTNKCSFYINS